MLRTFAVAEIARVGVCFRFFIFSRKKTRHLNPTTGRAVGEGPAIPRCTTVRRRVEIHSCSGNARIFLRFRGTTRFWRKITTALETRRICEDNAGQTLSIRLHLRRNFQMFIIFLE